MKKYKFEYFAQISLHNTFFMSTYGARPKCLGAGFRRMCAIKIIIKLIAVHGLRASNIITIGKLRSQPSYSWMRPCQPFVLYKDSEM